MEDLFLEIFTKAMVFITIGVVVIRLIHDALE